MTVACWVSESMCPFLIIKDQAFQWLCKTGQPHFYLPNKTTVAKDVKFLYSWSERRIAEELQINFSPWSNTEANELLIELSWAASLPAGLLDLPQPLCLHECLGDMDSQQRANNGYA